MPSNPFPENHLINLHSDLSHHRTISLSHYHTAFRGTTIKSTLRVLIADDSVLVRERLQAWLAELEGVEVVGQCGNALKAIEAVRELRPDVAILDIRMPGGSGLQVLEAAKASETPPLVIMLTAFAYPQYRAKCLAAGADYFFDKAEFEDVLDVLGQLSRARANPAL